ncbi:glycosyltransferase [Singulisphaera sp. PoT]|uniref:glycosyltransferase n=1 Tax=Singulisphaera sp. PoT TaxID=3411797 RepID=UPI003BF59170
MGQNRVRDILGAYHVALFPTWREVAEAQCRRLRESGLLAKAGRILVGVVGDPGEDLSPLADWLGGRAEIRHLGPLSLYEFPTLQWLHDEALRGPGGLACFYIHTKAVSHRIEAGDRHRHRMEAIVLDKHEACLELLEGHDACGGDWKLIGFDEHRPHFSGNFWWANASYLRRLTPPRLLPAANRYEAEFWIGSDPGVRAFGFPWPSDDPYAKPSAWAGLEGAYRGLIGDIGPIRRVVDLGVDYGATTFRFAQDFPDAEVLGVSTFALHDDAEAWVRAHLHLFPNARIVKGPTAKVGGLFRDPVDLLHIDDDHSFDAVARDFYAWLPALRPGGCVLFHDTRSCEGVRRFFENLEGEKREIPEHNGLGCWIKPGRASGGAPARIAPAAPVAVVIPCHNYGRFLGDAIESVLAQEARAAEVVVVDDSSSDQTAEVARGYESRGVRYLRVEHRDVFRTRAAGLAATASEFLCFLDADDMLPPDYLASGLPSFEDRRVGFAYSDLEMFGDQSGPVRFPKWDPDYLECENYVHAGSLARRSALVQSGAYRGPSPTPSHADWYVWRLLADRGWIGAKQPAAYRYRKHGGSMLAGGADQAYFDKATLRLAPVTIFTALSGRRSAWQPYLGWLRGQAWPRGQCRLVLMDTSGDRDFGAMVRRDLASLDYPDARYFAAGVGEPGLADMPRAENAGAVRLACSRIYAAMARELSTPWAMIVEDDVIPEPDVIGRLLRGMDPWTAMVVAPYVSRYHRGFVCWDDEARDLPEGSGLQEIGGSGFGCTLIRRAALRDELFGSGPGESPDYDIAYCARLRKRGWTIKADWSQNPVHLGAASEPIQL